MSSQHCPSLGHGPLPLGLTIDQQADSNFIQLHYKESIGNQTLTIRFIPGSYRTKSL